MTIDPDKPVKHLANILLQGFDTPRPSELNLTRFLLEYIETQETLVDLPLAGKIEMIKAQETPPGIRIGLLLWLDKQGYGNMSLNRLKKHLQNTDNN